jgi:AcrR family transcriptional regulator
VELRTEREFTDAIDAIAASFGGAPAEGTARDILEAMAALIVEAGITQFSMRAIAGRVGISLASLQYHYPSRADLLARFFAFQAERYGAMLRQTLVALSRNPEGALRFTVELLLDDALDPRTGTLYTQLRALAAHDPEARRAMDQYMALYVRFIDLLVSRFNRGLSAPAVRERAIAIVALIEGFAPASSAARAAGADPAVLARAIVDLAVALAAPGAAGEPA